MIRVSTSRQGVTGTNCTGCGGRMVGVIDIHVGDVPTLTVATTMLLAMSMTETVLDPEFAT